MGSPQSAVPKRGHLSAGQDPTWVSRLPSREAMGGLALDMGGFPPRVMSPAFKLPWSGEGLLEAQPP